MTLSDSRPDQYTIVSLRVATPHPGRVSHVAQDTFLHNRIVTGRDPASGTGLPRCPRYLPDMLSPLPRWIGIGGSVTSLSRLGLPRILGGSASTTVLSGPSQGSLTLRPARLLQPYRLTSVPRASAGRSPYPTVWVATGMNRQCPGRNFHPLVSCALVAHQYVVVIESGTNL
jgi:hypothetical protein